MEKQRRLFQYEDHSEDSEIFEGKKPEIKIVKNTFMSAGAMIREIIIRKTWIIPTKNI